MLARIATGTVGAMFVIGYGVCIARVLNYLVDHTNEQTYRLVMSNMDPEKRRDMIVIFFSNIEETK